MSPLAASWMVLWLVWESGLGWLLIALLAWMIGEAIYDKYLGKGRLR